MVNDRKLTQKQDKIVIGLNGISPLTFCLRVNDISERRAALHDISMLASREVRKIVHTSFPFDFR